MTNYLVSYTETNVYSMVVEADSDEHAEQLVREEILTNDTASFRLVDRESFIQSEGKA